MITGASSGIGRATALAFAAAGAGVVLAARREEPLRALAGECRHAGAPRSLVVPTDVRDPAAVEALAAAAGDFDVWVNNAAVVLFGRFEETPADLWREVLEVNLFGVANGARAALPVFRRRGGGTLINVGSVNSYVAFPYLSSYMASKHALRAFTESLRQEVRGDGINVCAVLPAAVDTPLFQHAGNYYGRAAKPLRPFIHPDRVAAAIVRCAKRPKRELVVGASGRATILLHALAPRLLERIGPRLVDREFFRDEPLAPTPGNLREPMPEWTGVTGGWKAGDASPTGAPDPGARWAGVATAAAAAAAMLALVRR